MRVPIAFKDRQGALQQVPLRAGITEGSVGRTEVCQRDGDLPVLWAVFPLFDREGPLQQVLLCAGITEGAVGIAQASG